jgi:hypothetical protein
MSHADAEAILGWHYDEPYEFYDPSFDSTDLAEFTNPSFWRMRDLEGPRRRARGP